MTLTRVCRYGSFDWFMARREQWNLRLVLSVREPTNHILSLLRHEHHPGVKQNAQLTLLDVLKKPSVVFHRYNIVANLLSGVDQNATHGDVNLTRAFEVIDSAYLVLCAEYLDASIDLLLYLLGVGRAPPCSALLSTARKEALNVHPKNLRPENLDSLLNRVEKMTRMDRLIYGRGLHRFITAFDAHCVGPLMLEERPLMLAEPAADP